MQDKPLRYRELKKRLSKFGVKESRKGKGSRRMLYHPNIDSNPAFIPIHPHSENHEFSRHIIRSLRDRFKINIKDFYK